MNKKQSEGTSPFWGFRSEVEWLERTVHNYPTFKRHFQVSPNALEWLRKYREGLKLRVRGFTDGPLDPRERTLILCKVRALERELKGEEDEER